MTHASGATLVALLVLASVRPAFGADYWNDAVSVNAKGVRRIELPPVNRSVTATSPRAPASWSPPTPMTSHVMEGPDGLVECVTNDYRGDGRCHAYTPGQYSQPRLRVWVVKRNGGWWQCADPRTRNMCTRSASDCTGDAKSTDKCFPLHPTFSGWLAPVKAQP